MEGAETSMSPWAARDWAAVGWLGLDPRIGGSNTMGTLSVPHLGLGKLGCTLVVPDMAPGGWRPRICWQSGSSANFCGLTSPKARGKLSSGTRAGVEHRSPGSDAPCVPLVPHSFTGAIQRGARNGSTWGLHAPLTPVLMSPHPFLAFPSPSSKRKRAEAAPRVLGVFMASGAVRRVGKMLVFAKYCEQLTKRKNYPAVCT